MFAAIQGSIFKATGLKLENQEIIDFTKGILISNFAQYGMAAGANTSHQQSMLNTQNAMISGNQMRADAFNNFASSIAGMKVK